MQAPVDDLADLVLALVGVLAQREGGVVVDVHRAEQRPVLEQQAELLAHLEQLVVGHVGHRLAVHEHVAGVRVEQADDVLDQHALAGARGAEDHRDLVVGQAEVEAVEDPGAAELLDDVDDLDRVLAAVVALLARVPDVGVRLLRVDARDRVVLVQVAELGGRLLVVRRPRRRGRRRRRSGRTPPPERPARPRAAPRRPARRRRARPDTCFRQTIAYSSCSTRSAAYRRPRVGSPEDQRPHHPDDVHQDDVEHHRLRRRGADARPGRRRPCSRSSSRRARSRSP